MAFKYYSTSLAPPYKCCITFALSFQSCWYVLPLFSLHLVMLSSCHPQQYPPQKHCHDLSPLPFPHHTSFPIQSGGLFTNMYRSSLVDPGKLKKCIKFFIQVPHLCFQKNWQNTPTRSLLMSPVCWCCPPQLPSACLPWQINKGLRVHVNGTI